MGHFLETTQIFDKNKEQTSLSIPNFGTKTRHIFVPISNHFL